LKASGKFQINQELAKIIDETGNVKDDILHDPNPKE
jgi:hypothetical protein